MRGARRRGSSPAAASSAAPPRRPRAHHRGDGLRDGAIETVRPHRPAGHADPPVAPGARSDRRPAAPHRRPPPAASYRQRLQLSRLVVADGSGDHDHRLPRRDSDGSQPEGRRRRPAIVEVTASASATAAATSVKWRTSWRRTGEGGRPRRPARAGCRQRRDGKGDGHGRLASASARTSRRPRSTYTSWPSPSRRTPTSARHGKRRHGVVGEVGEQDGAAPRAVASAGHPRTGAATRSSTTSSTSSRRRTATGCASERAGPAGPSDQRQLSRTIARASARVQGGDHSATSGAGEPPSTSWHWLAGTAAGPSVIPAAPWPGAWRQGSRRVRAGVRPRRSEPPGSGAAGAADRRSGRSRRSAERLRRRPPTR
jgi:hypothetical protein